MATRVATGGKKKVVRGRGVRSKPKMQLPFGKTNYFLFAIGIVIILLGYIALAQGPADSFWSLMLAPILLVIGYVVVIPVAILYKDPKLRGPQGGH